MKIAKNKIAASVVLTLSGSVAFGQNTITTTSAADSRMVPTPEGDLFHDRVVPGWENGVYGFVGVGVDQLHTHVNCPAVKDGCLGNEVVNLTSGNHSEIDAGIAYRFNKYVALEATVALMSGGFNTSRYGATERDLRLAESASMGASWDLQPLRLRLDLPLMTGLSVYGTVGVGIKDIQTAIGELDAKETSTSACLKKDPVTGICIEATGGGFFQAVADPPNRVYFPASVGAEWWIFQSPDWALNINYQPPQGSGPKFYRFSVSIVGALF